MLKYQFYYTSDFRDIWVWLVFWLTCCAVTSSRTKSNLEEKGFLSLTSRREVRAETQGGSLETGSEAEAIEEHCYAGLLTVACLACFLIPLRTTYPGVGLSTVGSALLYQLLIKKMIHRLAYRAIRWGIFSIALSSSQMVLACVKLKKKINQQSQLFSSFVSLKPRPTLKRGWPEMHSVAQNGLEILWYPCLRPLLVLGLQAWDTIPNCYSILIAMKVPIIWNYFNE